MKVFYYQNECLRNYDPSKQITTCYYQSLATYLPLISWVQNKKKFCIWCWMTTILQKFCFHFKVGSNVNMWLPLVVVDLMMHFKVVTTLKLKCRLHCERRACTTFVNNLNLVWKVEWVFKISLKPLWGEFLTKDNNMSIFYVMFWEFIHLHKDFN